MDESLKKWFEGGGGETPRNVRACFAFSAARGVRAGVYAALPSTLDFT